MNRDSKDRVWVVSELYYPEQTSTGHILTQIAEGLTDEFRVRVLCGQPSYSARGVKAPSRETRNGVDIRRCWATTWNKDVLLKRVVNLLTISFSIFFRMLVHLRRGDRVLVVTNPPLLPFFASIACRLRRAKCLLLIHDVYPDVAVAAGMLRAEAMPTRCLNWFVRRLYRSVDRIAVLGRDMRNLVRDKLGDRQRPIDVITNWADLDMVSPQPRDENNLLQETGLTDKFVVQYAGNMGPLHNIEEVLESAVLLRDHQDVHFLVIGSGRKQAWLEGAVEENGLTNVTILPPKPRSESQDFLNACDVAVNAFVPGMLGVSVPSRTYNILAVGKPILAVMHPESELALVVEEEQAGWVIPPGRPADIADAILEAKADPDGLAEMGRRARAAAESKYQVDRIVDAFATALRGEPG